MIKQTAHITTLHQAPSIFVKEHDQIPTDTGETFLLLPLAQAEASHRKRQRVPCSSPVPLYTSRPLELFTLQHYRFLKMPFVVNLALSVTRLSSYSGLI